MPDATYSPADWFWIVGGDESRFYSSAARAYVDALPEGAGLTRIASEDELFDVLRAEAPGGLPDGARNRIHAGDILDLLPAEDYAVIQGAIADSLDLKRWWETLLTRYEPVVLDNARFLAAWQALESVLGAERCAALMEAIRARAFA